MFFHTISNNIKEQDVPGGAAIFFEGFVNTFLKVPQAIGQYCSCHAAQQARGTFRKHISKPSEQVAAPPSSYLLPRQAFATHMEKYDKILRLMGRTALY